MPLFFSQGNNRFLSEFARQQDKILRNFQASLSRELTRGLRGRASSSSPLERQLRQQVEKLTKLTLDRLTDQFGGGFSGTSRNHRNSAGASLGSFPLSPITSILGTLIGTGVSGFFNRTRTSTVSYETQRSQEALQAFRESRGQAQARAAYELSQGQRHL